MIHRLPLIGAPLALLAVLGASALAAEPTGVSSDLEQTASSTPEEKVAYAEGALEEIRASLDDIEKMLNQQKAKGGEGSTDAINCLRLKATSVLALNDVARSATVAMQEALNDDNDELANHEYRKLAVALSKTRQLLGEAQGCASDGSVTAGSTIVDWENALENVSDLDPLTLAETATTPAVPPVTPFQ